MTMNRCLAMLLAVVLVFGCAFPVTAAESEDGQNVASRGSYVEVGVLTIVSSNGHTFLVLENTSTFDYDIGSYTVNSGETITIGTFPSNNDDRPRSGIYINYEAYGVHEVGQGLYRPRYSLSVGVDYADILAIDTYVSTPSNNTWMENRKCYVFAAEVWNLVGGVALPENETLLMAIINSVGYSYNITLPSCRKSETYYFNSYGSLVPIP